MTENKRFTLSKDTEWWFVSDNTIKVNEFGYREDLTGEDKYRGLQQDLTEQEVVDKLNELAEENQRLKGRVSSWKITASDEISEKQELMKQIVKLKEENKILSDELEQAKAVIHKKWTEYLKKKELI